MPWPQRSSAAVGVRSTPLDGDVAGTHNGLHSHGRVRCLVFSRTLVARLPVDTYQRELGNVETREPLAKWAVNQLGAKNGEWENSEIRTRGGRVQPPGLHTAPQASFPNRRILEHVRGSPISYENGQKWRDPGGIALRGLALTSGSPEFVVENLAPQAGFEPAT